MVLHTSNINKLAIPDVRYFVSLIGIVLAVTLCSQMFLKYFSNECHCKILFIHLFNLCL